MAVIGFFMLPEPGHLNGPIKLAKSLEKSGHQACFFGLSYAEPLVNREGLKFVTIFEESNLYFGEINKRLLNSILNASAANFDWQALWDQAFATVSVNERDRVKRALDQMVERIQAVRPDLVFVDYYLLTVGILLEQMGIKRAILNPTLFEPDFIKGAPIDSFPLLKMPMVYLCPREFDLPHSEPPNYPSYYAGPSIDLDRNYEKFEDAEWIDDRPLLFCSLGSQPRFYAVAKTLIQTVIEVIAAKPGWQAILSLGGDLTTDAFHSIPPNVRLYNRAPQLEVLKRASVMITHGGLNSIKECIFMGVPMIVIPFDVDQPLNAARVAYHKLGLVEDLKTLSFDRLSSMIEEIEKEPLFKARVEAMGKKFREIENSGIGVKIVEELLNGSGCKFR